MNKVKELFIYTRPWSFPMTIIVLLLGILYSYIDTGKIEVLKYLIVLIGGLLFHAAVNLWNDYFDYKRNIDFKGSPTTIYRPHPIVTGGLSAKGVYLYALSVSIIGLGLGFLVYALWDNIWGPILGFIGLFLAYIYSGSPLATKYRALGEIEVFLAWGLLYSAGAYAIITGRFSFTPMLLSMPLGLLVVAVLTANNHRDIDYDSTRGIKTLSIILGKEKSLLLLELEIILAYLLLLLLITMRIAPISTVLALISFPKAISTLRMFKKQVPPNADPLVAQIAIIFGLFFIIGLIISIL